MLISAIAGPMVPGPFVHTEWTSNVDIMKNRDCQLNIDQTIKTLNAEGVCVFDGFLDHKTLKCLNDEFKHLFSRRIPGVSLGVHPPGKMATVDTKRCKRSALPTILEIFLSTLFRSVAQRYLPHDSVFHDKIVATHEVKIGPTSDIHFDTLRTLKFLFYLIDVDESDGAFRYGRGTHAENTAYRERFLRSGGRRLDLQNIAADSESVELTPICAPAGSLIIFDTDGFHSGGYIKDGTRERKILRARSIFAGQGRLRPRRLSPMWFRRRFNIFLPKPPFEIPGRARTGGSSRRK